MFFKMNLMAIFRLFIVFTLILIVNTKKKSKSVTTLLEAKWERTPLVLEVAEYLAEENPQYFWDYVDSVSAMEPSLNTIGINFFI